MRDLSIPTLFGAAALILAAAFSGSAVAQDDPARAIGSERTISNVATLAWEQGAARFAQASNQVDIAVEAAPAVTRAIAYRLDPTGAMRAPIAGTRCGAANAPIAWGPAFAGMSLDAAGLTPTNRYNIGEPFVATIDHAAGNRDRGAVDMLDVEVRTDAGDVERLTMTETGSDTGRFAGAVPTRGGAVVVGDCRLNVRADGPTSIAFHLPGGARIAEASVSYLIDPFGIVFDSATGEPVPGVRVSLVDADTGRPAPVFGDDGVSAYPASVITGKSVTDAGGTRYDFAAGDYRFPLAPPGRYRLRVEPPAPYAAPSVVPREALAGFLRPSGEPYALIDASYGEAFTLANPAALRVDIPIDAPAGSLLLTKSASVATAEPGDVVQYRIGLRNGDAVRATGPVTLTDAFPAGFRLRPSSVRFDGAPLAVASADGRGFTAALPSLAPGATGELRYILEVLGDARAGDAVNRAQAVARGGARSPVADAVVRVGRETIAGRMTITGRVTDGGCLVDPGRAAGVAGVRVMLEDGSYAVTDADGRYHFEGVEPGIHVVQMDVGTLPADRAAADCARDTRSAGRAWSRFVEGAGGAHKRVDFRIAATTSRGDGGGAAAARPTIASDAAAAGAEVALPAGASAEPGFLFPHANYNPRARATRVAIKHAPGQRVALLVDGEPADPLTLEGTSVAADGRVAVTRWRGLPLTGTATRLDARIAGADGAVAASLTRVVHFNDSAMRAEIVRERSLLVADGVTRPVIAVRFTTRDGRPVHHGGIGEFALPSPYRAAVEVDAQQARQLSGLERAQPFWRVDGDEGLAFIALEPTTASGAVAIDFAFRDGEARRAARVEAWLDAGDWPWTVVGFAAGTLGHNRLKPGIEALGRHDGKLAADGQIALYAKGRVRGRWLLTVAYDSDKRRADARFAGTIDPQAYYTIYADRSERRYDASSLRKLYLKLERPQFHALFGDFETGLTENRLTRFARALNGFKAEYRRSRFAASAFAADTPFTHRREEIQGNGLSGPYALRARDVLANSERIAVETRDRFRSNLIVETRLLTRHIDYDIDYAAGTIRFREPVLSRSSGLDPQFVIADYEVDGVAGRVVDAGGRASYENAAGTLKVGATGIREGGERGSTTLGSTTRGSTTLAGADLRYRPNASSEIRAEVAASARGGETAGAWIVEGELHGARTDLLAYARSQDSGFGVGQVNASEDGSRKIGIDARVRVTDRLSVSASGWREEYLDRDATRTAGRALAEYRADGLDLRAGLVFADDRLADGTEASSKLVQLGVSKRFGSRLEVDAGVEFALSGRDGSVDFPTRRRLGARYAVSTDVTLVGGYETADGDAVDARTLRIGFDLKPWAGARFAVTGNRQDISEHGPRSFAAYGLSQSLALGKRWTVDFTVDGNRTLGGIDPARVLNPSQPIAGGGFVGDGTRLAEDFAAVTAGATYRGTRWSANARAEYRAGDAGDRYGLAAAALRQVGEGSALGGAFNWNVAKSDFGPRTRTAGLALSWAHRPAASRSSWLERLELRDDRVENAVAGLAGPIGGAPLLVTGDARSRRIVNSLSVNWSPVARDGAGWRDRAEISLFWGARYASEAFGGDDVRGFSNTVGADVRFDVSDTLDVGVSASVRHGLDARAVGYAVGPNVGVTPFGGAWLSIGYNVAGFADRDFEGARYTRSGPYVTLRAKFDQTSVAELMRVAR